MTPTERELLLALADQASCSYRDQFAVLAAQVRVEAAKLEKECQTCRYCLRGMCSRKGGPSNSACFGNGYPSWEPKAQVSNLDAPGHTDLMISPQAIAAKHFPDTSDKSKGPCSGPEEGHTWTKEEEDRIDKVLDEVFKADPHAHIHNAEQTHIDTLTDKAWGHDAPALAEYKLKNGEEIRNGVLYGWTGELCQACGGYGEGGFGAAPRRCAACGGTGVEWGLMPNQPKNLPVPKSNPVPPPHDSTEHRPCSPLAGNVGREALASTRLGEPASGALVCGGGNQQLSQDEVNVLLGTNKEIAEARAYQAEQNHLDAAALEWLVNSTKLAACRIREIREHLLKKVAP